MEGLLQSIRRHLQNTRLYFNTWYWNYLSYMHDDQKHNCLLYNWHQFPLNWIAYTLFLILVVSLIQFVYIWCPRTNQTDRDLLWRLNRNTLLFRVNCLEGFFEVPNMYAFNKLEYKHRYISLYRYVPRQCFEYCCLSWETHSINVIILARTTTVNWHEWFTTVNIKINMEVDFRSNHNAFTIGKLHMTQHTEKSHERLQIWLGVPMFLCSVHQER